MHHIFWHARAFGATLHLAIPVVPPGPLAIRKTALSLAIPVPHFFLKTSPLVVRFCLGVKFITVLKRAAEFGDPG